MNYGTIARSLIALLFIVAGLIKITTFTPTVGYIASLGIPMSTLVTILVIFIEIVVAFAFAYGYKVKETGYILIGFTALTILVAHRDIAQQANLIAALKNIAIIGGIMASIACSCQDCVVHNKKG